MKQVTILMRAFGFLVVVGCSKAKYLLVEIADGVDEYVQYDEEAYDEYVPMSTNVVPYNPLKALKKKGISYSFEKI